MDENENLHRRYLPMDTVEKFRQIKTHEERFALVLKGVVNSSNVLLGFECRQKDSKYSIKLREDGNKSFMKSQYNKAVQEYTHSIMYAVASSEELALSYANRAAATFKLEKYEDSIKDIDRALELNYPERLKIKLYKRRGMCLRALGQPGAATWFGKALLCLDQMTIGAVESDEMKRELTPLMTTPNSAVKPQEKAYPFPVEEVFQPNPNIPSASDAITVKYSEKYGLHVVATRRIKPGEALVVESPFCQILDPKHVSTNCSTCLEAAWSMIPCMFCVNAAYCSESCKDKAWKEYHEVECPVGGTLLSLNIRGSIALGMRMAIVATEQGKKVDALRQELKIIDSNTDPAAKGYSQDGKILSDKYPSIHCVAPVGEERCSIAELISIAVGASIIVCALAKESKMFGKKLVLDTLATNPDVIFVGSLIYKHMHRGASFKSHRVASLFEVDTPRVFGLSLMAVSSLFNHSCYPNTIRQSRNRRMTIHAAHPIEEGEQLFDCYNNMEYTLMKKSQRVESLKRFGFTCDCIACKENWPFTDLPSYENRPIHTQKREKIKAAVKRFMRCKLGTVEADRHTLKELVNLIETLFACTKKPSNELSVAHDLLKLFHIVENNTRDYELTTPTTVREQRLTFLSALQGMIQAPTVCHFFVSLVC